MPTTNRAGHPVLTRFEARGRLSGIRSILRDQRSSLMHYGTKLGMSLEQAALAAPVKEFELDLAALDTCEAALETLGDEKAKETVTVEIGLKDVILTRTNELGHMVDQWMLTPDEWPKYRSAFEFLGLEWKDITNA